jgi:hypothetical protein
MLLNEAFALGLACDDELFCFAAGLTRVDDWSAQTSLRSVAARVQCDGPK